MLTRDLTPEDACAWVSPAGVIFPCLQGQLTNEAARMNGITPAPQEYLPGLLFKQAQKIRRRINRAVVDMREQGWLRAYWRQPAGKLQVYGVRLRPVQKQALRELCLALPDLPFCYWNGRAF